MMNVSGEVREVRIEAVVIRADGSREDLGTVAYWHKNPLRRAAWHAKKLVTKEPK